MYGCLFKRGYVSVRVGHVLLWVYTLYVYTMEGEKKRGGGQLKREKWETTKRSENHNDTHGPK